MGKTRIHRKNNTTRTTNNKNKWKNKTMAMLHRKLQLQGNDTRQSCQTHHQKTPSIHAANSEEKSTLPTM